MPNLKSQQYSQKAFECVKKHVQTLSLEEQKKYKTFAKRFPALIHTCGLAQTIAFANSKKEYKHNFEDLQQVLGNNNLIKDSQEKPVLEYLRLSRDALAATGWLKKYAEAQIED
jgi:CRISPR-associated protein Cmr5